jgi:protein arginine phosphatase
MKLFHALSQETIDAWQQIENPILLHYTGSMFGMGCDARNQEAISRLNVLKQRPQGSGYIVLVANYRQLLEYQAEMNPKFAGLIRQYSPGALTAVLPCSHPQLQHLLVDGKIAFRIPAAPLLREFLKSANTPLISTSINIAGARPQTDYRYILAGYKSWFELALLPENELVAPGEPSTVVTTENDELLCLREGQLDFSILKEDYDHPLITFVCTGNICRSPLAEYYFRQQAKLHSLPFRTASAGFMTNGVKISENSRIVLEHDGINANAHLSETLNHETIRRSRLVLTMTQNHKNNLLNTGWKSDHIYSLAEYIGKEYDVEDPYQEPLEVYQQTYKQIKYYIDLLIARLAQEKY